MLDKITYMVGENKVVFGQNANGTWKCSEISINCKDVTSTIKNEMKDAMTEAKKLISSFNNASEVKVIAKEKKK